MILDVNIIVFLVNHGSLIMLDTTANLKLSANIKLANWRNSLVRTSLE